MSRQVAEVKMSCPVCGGEVEIKIELDGRKFEEPRPMFIESLDMHYQLSHRAHVHAQHSTMYVTGATE